MKHITKTILCAGLLSLAALTPAAQASPAQTHTVYIEQEGSQVLLVDPKTNGAYILDTDDNSLEGMLFNPRTGKNYVAEEGQNVCGGAIATPRNLYDAAISGHQHEGSEADAPIKATFSWCSGSGVLTDNSSWNMTDEGIAYVCLDIRQGAHPSFSPTGGCATVGLQWQNQFLRQLGLHLDAVEDIEETQIYGVGFAVDDDDGGRVFSYGFEVPGQAIGYSLEPLERDHGLNLEFCLANLPMVDDFSTLALMSEETNLVALMYDCADGFVGTGAIYTKISAVCLGPEESDDILCAIGYLKEFDPTEG